VVLTDAYNAQHDHGTHDAKWKGTFAEDAKAKEKRRSDKTERDKKWQGMHGSVLTAPLACLTNQKRNHRTESVEAIDKLIIERDADKKWRETEAKKPGMLSDQSTLHIRADIILVVREPSCDRLPEVRGPLMGKKIFSSLRILRLYFALQETQ
jgi:hypothetical protein